MSQTSKRRCKCGTGGQGKCRNCSKIRMAIMLKNGYKNNNLDTTWYSFYNKNNQPVEQIVAGMIQRFKTKHEYKNAVNQLRFYNNQTNTLISVYKLTV